MSSSLAVATSVLPEIVEEWRIIAAAPNYMVSSLGRVRSVQIRYPSAIRAQTHFNGAKYLSVSLRADKKPFHETVHRLVAAAFCERPEGKNVVNHKNGVKEDNRAENLEWVTTSENHLHAIHVLKARNQKKVSK